ncbi:sulfide dehydrogenase [Thioalkalivibrio paradoxus ARh 1]|uniref:Sulfide dehydrogenase n=2 Tax=Thioalkalivibrio paradoxus TaxID=108010 RepID=W0DQP0_9GAMM|nr:sulfide dehydrogenase [Thioalkalivibrio paradoxus ARh 1]
MMRRTRLKAIVVAGLLTAGSAAVADNTPMSGQMLAFQCAGCHGYNGHSVGPATPSLAGFPKEYFVDSMMAYKDGSRYATIMDRVAMGYTEEQFEAMAEFFAAQPYLPAQQDYDPELAERGAEIHDQHCNTCHSEGGRYPEPDTAPIAGQWMPYLRDSFEDFRDHGRWQPRGMERRLLSVDDLEALVHYYGSQQDPAAYVFD